MDWLIEGQEGYLETNPSTSPENSFIAPDGKPACVSYSTTMDMAIIREVFNAVAAAAEVKSTHCIKYHFECAFGGGNIFLIQVKVLTSGNSL